jgi:Icc-related predicted phosphoesterase
MSDCFFVSDLHGSRDKFEKLFQATASGKPQALFIGGDIFPHGSAADFVERILTAGFKQLRSSLGSAYPRVMLILGNDDVRSAEQSIIAVQSSGIWEYLHGKKTNFGSYTVYGYACVPPTPFMLKDWEKYDVSRYVSPGCIPPEEGKRTVAPASDEHEAKTMKEDLARLTGIDDLKSAILLFHSPPYDTALDKINIRGKTVEGVPFEEHVGSIAIRQLIEERQPLLSLHGHIHESATLTGSWRDKIGRTHCFNASHDGKELSLIKFDLDHLENAERILL